MLSISPRTTELLDQYSTRNYYVEYNKFLSNHISNALIALAGLNVGDEFTEQYGVYYEHKKMETAEQYTEKCGISVESEPITDETWLSFVDSDRNYYGLVEFYTTKLTQQFHGNIFAMIAHYISQMPDGMAGTLFHGIIHLGWGVHARHERTMLDGLAYYTFTHIKFGRAATDFPTPESRMELFNDLLGRDREDVVAVFERSRSRLEEFQNYIAQGATLDTVVKTRSRGFQPKLYALAGTANAELCAIVDRLNIPWIREKSEWLNLKHAVLGHVFTVYARSGKGNEFTYLHGVTSTFGLMNVIDACLEEEAMDVGLINLLTYNVLVPFVATFFVAGALEMGNDEAEEDEVDVTRLRELIEEIAVEPSKVNEFYDEHVYKICYVAMYCLERQCISGKIASMAVKNCTKPFFTD